MLWAGTDDGLLHVTTDDGATWQRVTPNMPEWSHVSLIDPSHFDAGIAYVAVDRHRLDDFKPYIFKTTDTGRNWTAITNGIPEGAYVRAVREDPKRRGLLYAGTELGRLCFLRRRRALAAAADEPADFADPRSRGEG